MTRSPTFQRRSVYGAITAGLLALAAMVPATAEAAEAIAQFDGGIGVIPATCAVNNGACAPITNNVNDTQPAGRPWVISDLHAKVAGDGSFDVRGKGLVLAGTGNVGRSAGLNVRIRLYCGVGTALVSFTSREQVQLEPNGDFRLSGDLPLVNPLTECPNAALLVLNAVNNTWFAAGIPK